MIVRTALAAAALLLAVTSAQAAPPGQSHTTLGYVLTDEKGMSLYIFDKDVDGKIACVDACAQNWPPLMAAAADKATGDYSIVNRADGAKQWAYKGKPLYRWIKDMKPGDTSGDGFKDLWKVARP